MYGFLAIRLPAVTQYAHVRRGDLAVDPQPLRTLERADDPLGARAEGTVDLGAVAGALEELLQDLHVVALDALPEGAVPEMPVGLVRSHA